MNSIREAQIILPKKTNDGRSLKSLTNELQVELTEAFGGCTMVAANGSWKEPSGKIKAEPVLLFTIAYQPEASRDALLLTIAAEYCARAEQIVVYVRKPDGTVDFVEPAKRAMAA